MDRAIPTASKIISKKINDRNRQLHLARLQDVKSSIPRETPASFNHLKSNKKKTQIHEEKLSEIERENRILLDKLTSIMKNPKNDGSDKKLPKSLNREQRKQELVKITMENYAFLKRLRDKKSMYDKEFWDQERKKNERYLKNISEYPLVLHNISSKTPKSPLEEAEGRRPQTIGDEKSGFRLHGLSTMQIYIFDEFIHKEHSSEKELESRRRPIRLEPMEFGPNQKKIPLHESQRKIGFSNFSFHIYLENGCINLLASNKDRPDYKNLKFNAKESERLILKYDDKWNKLIEKVRFAGNRIIVEESDDEIPKKEKIKVENNNEEGIIEIQDDNDENESFEKSENRAKEKFDLQRANEEEDDQNNEERGSREEEEPEQQINSRKNSQNELEPEVEEEN